MNKRGRCIENTKARKETAIFFPALLRLWSVTTTDFYAVSVEDGPRTHERERREMNTDEIRRAQEKRTEMH